MLLPLLFACAPSTLTEADLDGVHWAGDFAWDGVDDADDGGLVDFVLTAEGDGAFTGEYHYAGVASESIYTVTGQLDEQGVLTLSQHIVDEIDLERGHVWCEGDYVIVQEEGELVGTYFPRSDACLDYTGTARFE